MTGGPTKTFLAYLGANVRHLRVRQGMTQEALAEEANIDVRFLQRVERGTVNLRFHSFIRLAVALGIKPSALLRERKTIAPKAGRPKQIRRRTAE